MLLPRLRPILKDKEKNIYEEAFRCSGASLITHKTFGGGIIHFN